MPTSLAATVEETEIRRHIEALARALSAKDIEALMAFYAPNVVTFDLRPPLHVDGASAYRGNFEKWFGSMQGPIDFRIRDLDISANDEIGFCHYLAHVRSTKASGGEVDYWVRVTAGCRKIDGRWLVTHEHISRPIDPKTEQAA